MQDVRARLKAWKDDYNNRRPHGSLGHLTPSEFAKNKVGPVVEMPPVSNSELTQKRGRRKDSSFVHGKASTKTGQLTQLMSRK
jgi:hypothetical protein